MKQASIHVPLKRFLPVFICLFHLFGLSLGVSTETQQGQAVPLGGGSEPDSAQSVFKDIQRTTPFSEQAFDRLILKMHVSLFNNPSYWFEQGTWRQESADTWVSGGEKEIVSPYQFNVIKKVHYYRYKGVHPLDSGYYTKDEKTAAFLNRFCFYRFTGKTLIPAVDVYLFALDMHTGLIFSYALPTRFEKVWGHRIPRDWVALEKHPHIQEHFAGKQFYQFDPVGFVQADGKITLYEWIIKQNKRKAGDIYNYLPRMEQYSSAASASGPGFSPYKKMVY